MNWKVLCEQAEALLEEKRSLWTNLANASALLMEAMEEINWAGFYLLRGEILELGPFQGKPACLTIPVGKGVCGTAVERDQVLRIEDVHTFPGHIACDSASASEIVLPLHDADGITGVLDIDSPRRGRFSEEDEEGLAQFAQLLEEKLFRRPAESRRKQAYEEAFWIFHIKIDSQEITELQNGVEKVTFIPFGGSVASSLFTGKIRPGAADVQVTNPAGIRHMQAKYIFEGTDAAGNPCHLFVENNGYFEPGSNPAPFAACPTFLTDSPLLQETLQGKRFRAEGYGTAQGVDILII